MTVTKISGYNTSRDYPLLARLMRESSVLCTCQNFHCAELREGASTRYFNDGGKETFIIGSPGIGYVHAGSEETFIKQCKNSEVEFIVPLSTVPPDSRTPLGSVAAAFELGATIRPLLDNPEARRALDMALIPLLGFPAWKDRAHEFIGTPSTSLPTVAGFYWWRERRENAWRMVQAMDRGDGKLIAYDIEQMAFKARPLLRWEEEGNAVGEWLYVHPPATSQNAPTVPPQVGTSGSSTS